MTMKTISLTYPEDFELDVHTTPGELEAQIRLMAALKMFELGKISSGKAAELAGLSRVEFFEMCGRYRVPIFNYSPEDLEAEIISDMDSVSSSLKDPWLTSNKMISDIDSIGKTYAQKLNEAGIITIGMLLEKGATPQGRKDIKEKTGISYKLILEWVNLVEFFRIQGLREEDFVLLKEAGVNTVAELAQCDPEILYQKIIEINQQKKFVRQLPGRSQVVNWIEYTKKLPRAITK